MKRMLAVALLLLLLLCACGGEKNESDPAMLEYPGLKWGMTLEEVQEALGFADGDILDSQAGVPDPQRPVAAAYHDYSVGNLKIFGLPTARVVLRFHEYTGHEPGLAEMVVYFPDGYDGSAATDMDALRKALTGQYGKKAQAVTTVSWNNVTGEVDRKEYPYPGDDPCYWVTKTTAGELLTREELEKLYAVFCDSQSQARPDAVLPTLEEFSRSQENHAVTLELRTQAEGQYLDWVREHGGTGLVLTFNAQNVVHSQAIDRYFE